jgi:hypothetical protein
MKFNANHIEIDPAEAHLIGLPRQRAFSWNELAQLRSIAQVAFELEMSRECDYVVSVCRDLDIAMCSTTHRNFKTVELGEFMLGLSERTGSAESLMYQA